MSEHTRFLNIKVERHRFMRMKRVLAKASEQIG